MKLAALLDSNVLIAAISSRHEHHEPSASLFMKADPAGYGVAAHSYAEAYSTLTRKAEPASFGLTLAEAMLALEALNAATSLVGLTPARTFDAIRDYARSGGVGARLYDRLIGEAAVAESIPMVITWNTRHMRSLFPGLAVRTPREFLAGVR